MEKNNKIWIYLFILPAFLVFVIFYLYPIITVFITGFTEWNGFNPARFNGFENYNKILFYDSTFKVAMTNFLLWSLIAVFVHVPFGVIVAFILYKEPFGWKFTRGVFMIPNVIAISVWAVIYRFFFNDEIGMLNTFIRFIGFSDFHVNWFFTDKFSFAAITFTWVFYAVVITLLVLSDLMAIPKELHEAARIDGATEFQINYIINLPLVKGSIGTGIILAVVSRITMFEQIYLTTRGGPGNSTYNISLMLYDGIKNYQFGYANAVASIMIVLGVGIMLLVTTLFRMNKANH